MEEITRLLQLHERLEILYVVDGYLATFSTADGDRTIAEVHGETIAQALVNLEEELKKANYIDVYELRKRAHK